MLHEIYCFEYLKFDRDDIKKIVHRIIMPINLAIACDVFKLLARTILLIKLLDSLVWNGEVSAQFPPSPDLIKFEYT